MKQGGYHTQANGFTIVETMIVLAVSALLLGSAILLITGKQNKTEFTTGINGLKQQLQQIVNETASGYYPNDGNFSCTGNTTGNPPTTPVQFSAVGGNAQGTNGDCIFLGKTLMFGAPGQTADKFTVYPMAANRLGTNGQVATTLDDAWPTAIDRGTSNPNNPNGPSDSTVNTIPNGITFVSASYNGGVQKPDIFGIAFLSSLSNGVNSGNGALNSGSQQFSLYGFSGWPSPPTSPAEVVDRIDGTHTTANYLVLSTVSICFASGGTNQSGLITINNSLTVDLQIKDGTAC